jgi:hypothetical protein
MKRHCAIRRLLVPALVLTVTVLFLTAAVPHLHVDQEVGLWNHEHDLSLLATPAGGVPLPDGPLLLHVAVVVAAVLLTVCAPPATTVWRQPDSRAPPHA